MSWPSEEEIRDKLAQLIATPKTPFIIELSEEAYRFVAREYAVPQHFTSGVGASLHGGRFTPIGGPPTVYLARDRKTALAELDSYLAYYDIPNSAFQPRVLAAASVCVGFILDLTSLNTLKHIGISRDELIEEWRHLSYNGRIAPTQRFGRLVFEAGFDGMLVPSARQKDGANIVLFPDCFGPDSHAVMIDP